MGVACPYRPCPGLVSFHSVQTILLQAVSLLLCLGGHAQARYTVVCLCVCVSVCVSVWTAQLLKDESSASKSFYRLLVMFTWILIRGFAK